VWCDERDLLLFEDAAQSWLARSEGVPVGSSGDLAVFCLYKTLPIPDGAALVCDPAPPLPERKELGVMAWARDVMEQSPAIKRVGRRLRRGAGARVHDEFALGPPDLAPAWVSSRMLPRLVETSIPARRTANYEWLAGELESFVHPPFDTLPAGSSPMLLPLTLEAEQKRDVLDRLEAHDIEGVDFWSMPHPTLPVADFPRSAELRDTVVGVPVHQGLSADDRSRIVRAVRDG
jgi:dTDP-4-amino-4,6-dideoxygalactose transaminase